MTLKALKKKLRERVHVMLREKESRQVPDAPLRVRDLFLAHFQGLEAAKIVSGTLPIKNEIDPRPLMEALAARGHALCLPIHGKRGTPLLFRAYRPGDPLAAGEWGIPMPLPQAPERVPDILLVPLLAFDRAGRRLGYGGGYYDATLAALRKEKPILAVGIAYAAQEVEEVPAGPLDQKLDAVVTERGVILPT